MRKTKTRLQVIPSPYETRLLERWNPRQPGWSAIPGSRTYHPYAQGDLDGMCGVYSIINALRLASGPATFDEHYLWENVFAHIASELFDKAETGKQMVNGMGIQKMLESVAAACQFVSEEYGFSASYMRAKPRGKEPSIRQFFASLGSKASKPYSAVIIGIGGYLSHWSVIKGFAPGALLLFDSYGNDRLRLDCCRMKHQPRLKTHFEYVFSHRDVITIHSEAG